VQEVWYFRENAGMAELLGADANTDESTTKAATTAKKLLSRVWYLITIDPPE